MSQEAILNILKSNRRKWFSKSELIPLIPINDNTITRNVSRLVKFSACYGLKTKKGKRGKNFLRFD